MEMEQNEMQYILNGNHPPMLSSIIKWMAQLN